MAYEIVRKKRFLNKLTQVLEFLQHEWGNESACNFLEIIDGKVESLSNNPYIGAFTGVRETRSLYITKHNRIFYKIVDDKIFILNMYDARKRTYLPPE